MRDKTPAGFPVIQQFPTIRVIETGHTAVMQCKATGSPPPKIFWIKDMKRVDMTNPRYSINNEGHGTTGLVNSSISNISNSCGREKAR
uniref:Ig-like domain-containing protein n=1 Tax=Anopheles dirus TaxID=7168 RepID=A0A182NNQ1_9DIPT